MSYAGIRLRLPNPPSRQWAIRLHDLHHVATRFAQGQGNNPGGLGNLNYYWYEAENAERFWIIPWDMDNALAGNAY